MEGAYLITAFKYMKGVYREDGDEIFCVAIGDRTTLAAEDI